MGLCGLALRLVAEAAPAAAAPAITGAASSTTALPKGIVDGVALGKRSSEPHVDRIGMLLPRGAVLTIIDVFVSQDIHRLCDYLLVVPGLLEGCVPTPGRSALDIAQLGRLYVEKLLELGSRGCMLQTDIRVFHDGIDVVKSASCAAAEGLPHSVAAVAVRHQLAPLIRLHVACITPGVLSHRTSGAMTGSRVAGTLGRRLVMRTLGQHLWQQRHAAACWEHSIPMLMATYVDNLLLLGPDASIVEATFDCASGSSPHVARPCLHRRRRSLTACASLAT